MSRLLVIAFLGALLLGCLQQPREELDLPSDIEGSPCQPQLNFGASWMPLALFTNVTVLGNQTINLSDGTNNFTVNATVIMADNDTLYAYNITVGNASYGVIQDNVTIFHSRNLSAVDVLKSNATRVLNLTGAMQATNDSCAPTAVGPVILRLNRTHPGIMGGMNLTELIGNMTVSMGTSNGTSAGGIIVGITKLLNRTNYSKNFTIEVYVPRGRARNATSNGMSISILNTSANYTGIRREFIDKRQYLIIGITYLGNGHILALDDLGTVPKANGKFDVSFMDPSSGLLYVTEMEPDGSFDYLGAKARLDFFISLSPK